MKTSVNIKLNSIQDVQNFVKITSQSGIDIDLYSGKYIVDGKSIMGIFSLDLMHPVKLIAQSSDNDAVFDLLKLLNNYIVDEE